MPISINVDAAAEAPAGAAVGIGVFSSSKGPRIPSEVAIAASVAKARGFEAKPGQVLAIPSRSGTQILVGLGEPSAASLSTYRNAGAALARAAFAETTLATSIVDGAPTRLDRGAVVQAFIEGALLASYQFQHYKSVKQERSLSTVAVTGRRGRSILAGIERAKLVCEAVALARDLVNEPAMTLTPPHFADVAVEIGARCSLDVEVWDQAEIRKQRLGGLNSVSLGSDQPPRFVKLTYVPKAEKGRKPATLAWVGKGITFDSGGLSLKPNDGMLTMKCDMGGAAAVLAAMSVLARLEVKCRVDAYLCITENMPGPSAYKLLDVLTARNGKTVEVHNTDAEGRLVLMDGLSIAAEAKPDAIVDVATLTGAQVVALGGSIAGLISNNDSFAGQVLESATRAGEELWRLPLFRDYRRQLDSPVADMKNIGNPGQAGTIIAGLFLEEFVAGRPWAHLDIAGPAFTQADEGILTRGGTGFSVRTLIELASNFKSPK